MQAGDTLSGIAARSGTTTADLALANCLADADRLAVGQQLRVPRTPIPQPTATQRQFCLYNWFFQFNEGEGQLVDACPGPALYMDAIGQDFEGGRVYWTAPFPGSTDPRGTVWVIYNDNTWETYPDIWDGTPLPDDPAFVPPPGRYEPEGAIGVVWRDSPNVRDRLGWAYEPAVPFQGRFQQPATDVWPDNTAYWYADHGKWGLVLRLYSVNMGPNTWEVVGSY